MSIMEKKGGKKDGGREKEMERERKRERDDVRCEVRFATIPPAEFDVMFLVLHLLRQ